MRVEEVNRNIVGLIFNGVLVTQVTDGTLETVPSRLYRYKFPVKNGYLKDAEERVIIKTSPRQMFGARVNGKQYGTELIDVVCADPDDKRVWWVLDPVFIKKIIDRDPGTRRAIKVDVVDKMASGRAGVGTYQEFVDLVNSRNGQGHPEDEGDFAEPVGGEPDEDVFSEDDVEFIKANYKDMTDAAMANELGVDVDLLKDYRLRTLKLKKSRGGAR